MTFAYDSDGDDQSNVDILNPQVSLLPEGFVVVKVFGKTKIKCIFVKVDFDVLKCVEE